MNPAIPASNLRSIEVLLVDDNETNLLIGAAVLRNGGCTPDVCNSGEAAALAAEAKSYDLILMDCMMPGIDGCEATRIIRNHEKSQNVDTPIVALTSDASLECRNRCEAAGMTGYLSKPLRVADLSEKIDDWLSSEVKTVQADEFLAEACRGSHVFDKSLLLSLYEDDDEDVSEIIETFKEHLAQYYRELQDAIDSSAEWETLRFQSHLLKGSLKTIGADRFGIVAEKMEDACIRKDVTTFEYCSQAIGKEYDALVEALGTN